MLPSSYEFTPLDEIIPPLFFGIIYAFPCDEHRREVALKALQEGYNKLLELWPYLGGDIVRDNCSDKRPGHLSLVISEKNPDTEIPVVDFKNLPNSWTHSYTEVLEAGLPVSWLDASIFAPYAAGNIITTKPFTVQANWIPGGCLLTCYFSHAVIDATGAARILQCWAKLCRKFQDQPDAVGGMTQHLSVATPRIDFSASGRSFDSLKTRPELWKLLGLDCEGNWTRRPGTLSTPTVIPAAGTSSPGMRTVVFTVSPSSAARLKEDITTRLKNRWISTNDALAALLWRSVMRARFPNATKPLNGMQRTEDPIVRVNVPVNGRSLFQPKLPSSYINNVIFHCTPGLPLSKVVGPEPLAQLASTIRDGINVIKSDTTLVRDAAVLASLIPDIRSLESEFKDFLGSELATSSWVDFPFYDVDFGPVLGKPDLIRIPRGQWTEFCLLGPRKQNGDVEVFISLKSDQMERLLVDTEFQSYAQFVCE
ncbi:hypothetical protein RRF57_012860 [Xylaria bambusicola]|uniref:Trichothecene 3-O-acetyltransferase-like N-terminal domain-containing protein n=1 Tax=Xylaria bambusicola TaxID=326684 RepID=A0AAN7ZF20_9PEZI